MYSASQAPLYEALMRHAGRNTTPLHVPGHKQRPHHQASAEWDAIFGAIRRIDVTELSDTDDLHDPTGVIAQAEKLAASCFGAEQTFFLIGGSTAGNLAMILGACEPDDLLLVQRNVHKSVIHGAALAGARCVFLQPERDPISGLALTPSCDTIKREIERYPEAKGLLLTNPNYYGQAADLSQITAIAHAYNIPVLVDEAHGAHFGHHPDLPGNALQAGADAVVQSTHKMLSSLTMGAMLHVQGSLIRRESIRQALRMVQSSSPSYPILASLDLARMELQAAGSRLFNSALAASASIRAALTTLPFKALDGDDPLKLSLYEEKGRLSGFELMEQLEAQGCLAEMADPRYVVLALGPGTTAEDGDAVISALKNIAARLEHVEMKENIILAPGGQAVGSSAPEVFLPTEEEIPQPIRIRRSTSRTQSVPLHEALGRVAGEWVIPYPPGIPLLYPGEQVTGQAISDIMRWESTGARFQGAADSTMTSLQVVCEE